MMALPFLPEEDITSTYFAIKKPFVDLTLSEMELVKSLENYFCKTWIDGNESISVFTTNLARIIMLNLITCH